MPTKHFDVEYRRGLEILKACEAARKRLALAIRRREELEKKLRGRLPMKRAKKPRKP